MLFAAASLGFAQKFSIKLTGGLNYAGGGDFSSGLQGQMDYLKAEYNVTGAYRFPNLGINASGEFIFHFTPNIGLGLGVGYFQHVKEGKVAYDFSFVKVEEMIKPKTSVIPITANIHYLLPVSSKINLDFSAGGGAYFTTLNWDYRSDVDIIGLKSYDQSTFKSTKTGFGLQAGVGLEYALSAKIAIGLNIVGRCAQVSGFKGAWTDSGGGDLWSYSDSGSDRLPWYYDWKLPGGHSYPQIVFQEDQPAGSTVANARLAKLILSGFSVTIGLKIDL